MDVVQAFQQARNITRICFLGVSVQARQICLQNVPNIHFYIKNFTADPYLEQASQTFPVYYKFQENRDLNYEKKNCRNLMQVLFCYLLYHSEVK